MRYLIQLAIPAAILIITVLLLSRHRNAADRGADETSGRSDTGMFFLILLIGAAVAITAFFVLGNIGL